MDAVGPYINLGTIIQRNGKKVYAWAAAGKWPEGKLPDCNKITMEYPKGSGKIWTFPEIDEVRMLPIKDARKKLKEEQHPFLDRLVEKL
jgi:predicted NUDIX family NTP pyrophosphohydrolase